MKWILAGMACHAPTMAVIMLLLFVTGTHAGTGAFVVAMAAGGDVYWWHQTQSNGEMLPVYNGGDALQPFIAPDGNTVAFTTGANGEPLSLWAVAHDAEARQIVLPGQIDGALIDQVEWLDATTVYFNTSTISAFGAVPNNDLWRVDALTGELTNTLPAGTGGAFDIAPNGEHIAVVAAGTFDEAGLPAADGTITLINPMGGESTAVLSFPPVQTYSHSRYYPPVQWHESGDVLYMLIPDQLFSFSGETVTMTIWAYEFGGNPAVVQDVAAANGLEIGLSAAGEAYDRTIPPDLSQLPEDDLVNLQVVGDMVIYVTANSAGYSVQMAQIATDDSANIQPEVIGQLPATVAPGTIQFDVRLAR